MAAQSGLEEPPAQYGRYPRSIGAFLEATQSQIFVMQLPNVLPCVTDDADDVPAPKEQSAPMCKAINLKLIQVNCPNLKLYDQKIIFFH